MTDKMNSIVARRVLPAIAAILSLFLAPTPRASASVAVLMEESYGHFGAITPTGHAAVYLSHVCAASPTELRPCRPGELGVVISRYHKIGGFDWIAIPLVPYLYAVDDPAQVPASVDKAKVAKLRDSYRRANLESLAPNARGGRTPGGDWTQLVGSSYDRTIHGFQVISNQQQDARFIALFNDRDNVSHFNLLFHNCSDFARAVLDIYLPHSIHRNFIADIGLTTPKQVARSLVKYSKDHPEIQMSAFVIQQVPGSIKRSHPADGIAESLVKSKKYLLPLAILNPELTGAVVVAYLAEGRGGLPKNAAVFNADDVDNVGKTPRSSRARPIHPASPRTSGSP
jgi:hypothetical protein